MKNKIKALVICTENSCRSQMAEGLLKYKSNGRINVSSAGFRPKRIHPDAIKIMEEISKDFSGQTSNNINGLIEENLDIKITGCYNVNRSCPNFPVKIKKLHWSIKDPFLYPSKSLSFAKNFKEVRKELDGRVDIFLNRYGKS